MNANGFLDFIVVQQKYRGKKSNVKVLSLGCDSVPQPRVSNEDPKTRILLSTEPALFFCALSDFKEEKKEMDKNSDSESPGREREKDASNAVNQRYSRLEISSACRELLIIR